MTQEKAAKMLSHLTEAKKSMQAAMAIAEAEADRGLQRQLQAFNSGLAAIEARVKKSAK